MSPKTKAEIESISAERLCAITGWSDQRHRQLAKLGYFPLPIETRYALVDTFAGIVRYLREARAKAEGTAAGMLVNQRTGKMDAERRLAELELKRQLGEVVAVKAVERAWSFILQAVRSRWLQLPARAVPIFPTLANGRALEAWLEKEVASLLTELAEHPDYDLPKDVDELETTTETPANLETAAN